MIITSGVDLIRAFAPKPLRELVDVTPAQRGFAKETQDLASHGDWTVSHQLSLDTVQFGPDLLVFGVEANGRRYRLQQRVDETMVPNTAALEITDAEVGTQLLLLRRSSFGERLIGILNQRKSAERVA